MLVLKIFVYLQKILNVSEQNKKIKEKIGYNIDKTIGNCNYCKTKLEMETKEKISAFKRNYFKPVIKMIFSLFFSVVFAEIACNCLIFSELLGGGVNLLKPQKIVLAKGTFAKTQKTYGPNSERNHIQIEPNPDDPLGEFSPC